MDDTTSSGYRSREIRATRTTRSGESGDALVFAGGCEECGRGFGTGGYAAAAARLLAAVQFFAAREEGQFPRYEGQFQFYRLHISLMSVCVRRRCGREGLASNAAPCAAARPSTR
jgi:hypothetical protein